MKQWEMNIKGITHVKVLADNYEEAVKKGLLYVEENDKTEWSDFAIVNNSVEIVSQ